MRFSLPLWTIFTLRHLKRRCLLGFQWAYIIWCLWHCSFLLLAKSPTETSETAASHIKLPTIMLLCLINWLPDLFRVCPGFLDSQQQHNTYVTGEQICILYHAVALMGLPDKHREVPSVCVQSPVVVRVSRTQLTSPLLRPKLTPGIFL